MEQKFFRDRREAGRMLADKLGNYAGRPDVPRPSSRRGAGRLRSKPAARRASLDLFLVRKLGVPGREELAMGALATGGVRVLNDDVVRALQIPQDVIGSVVEKEQQELERRDRLYRGGRPSPELRDRIVILVDDGLATGATMHAAVQAVTRQKPARIVVAVPTAAPETCDEFRADVDEIICAVTPEPFRAVGLWYEDFFQTTDEEIRDLLSQREEGLNRGGSFSEKERV